MVGGSGAGDDVRLVRMAMRCICGAMVVRRIAVVAMVMMAGGGGGAMVRRWCDRAMVPDQVRCAPMTWCPGAVVGGCDFAGASVSAMMVDNGDSARVGGMTSECRRRCATWRLVGRC